jgi:hypothetical protein
VLKRLVTTLAGFTIVLVTACGGGDDPALPSGVTTALPTQTTEATATAERTSTPAATATPTDTPQATVVPSTATPTELSDRLAALGGEDSALIAGLLEVVAPRCQQSPEEFAELLDRGWTLMRDRGVALPIASLLSRIATELPPGSSRENCETLITAVFTQLANR